MTIEAYANEMPVLLVLSNDAEHLLSRIKGAVAAEWSPEGTLAVLINDGTSFSWRDVTECIPSTSSREYAPSGSNLRAIVKAAPA